MVPLGKNDKKKRKKHPPQGDDAGTVSAGTCRVGRGEQGEARPAIGGPRGGPHLDLERLRLKTWSKSDFSIACLLYTSPSPRDKRQSRMPSSA